MGLTAYTSSYRASLFLLCEVGYVIVVRYQQSLRVACLKSPYQDLFGRGRLGVAWVGLKSISIVGLAAIVIDRTMKYPNLRLLSDSDCLNSVCREQRESGGYGCL